MNPFKDPFAGTPESELCHTSIDIPRRLQSYLASLNPKRGVVQTTVNILLSKAENLLRETIDEYNPDEYERVIADSVLRCALADTAPQAGSGDDNGGTGSTSAKVEGPPTESPSPHGGAKRTNNRKATKGTKASKV